ncbi:MAG: DNA polymerase III subunit delta [Pseudomonadota bacterium]
MVALKGKAITGALAKRDKAIAAFVVYGPDQGLVRERAKTLMAQVITDSSDPFNMLDLTDADIKTDSARLTDEICALSFMGGERVIRLRAHGEAAAPAVVNLLTALDQGHLKPNGIVIVEAGDLGPRSALRKGFEKAKAAAAMPCYVDGPAVTRKLAEEMATAHGLKFHRDALTLLTATLGEDRALSRMEIEKLLLFKSPGPDHDKGVGESDDDEITVADVKICLVDSASDDLDRVFAACADGMPGPLAAALFQCTTAGANPVTILRALQRSFARLETARGYVDKGQNANEAMKRLRPPVFFGEQDAFRQRLKGWTGSKLQVARRRLIEAEFQAKSTGLPHREIVERTAFQLCALFRR